MSLIRVDVRGLGIQDNIWQNTFHFDTPADVTALDPADVLADIRDWVESTWSTITGLVNVAFEALEIVIAVVDLITKVETFYTNGNWSWQGSSTSEALPAQIAASIQVPARNFRRGAQKRIAGLSEGPSNAGLLSAGTIAGLGAFGAAWIAGPTANLGPAFTPVVYRPTYSTVEPLLNTVIVNTIAGNQVTRKPGRGS